MEGPAASRERASGFRTLFDDEQAFRVWYGDAVTRVYGYLYHRTGGMRSVAEELTQETFVDAVRNRNRYDGRSDPLTWVIAIARHKLADHYRQGAREEQRRLKLVSSGPLVAEDDPAAGSERREDILRALRSLPSMQRAALALHYLDELSVRQIAAQLGRSEVSVESLLSRGRAGFRRALAEPEPVPGEEEHV